MGNFHGPLRVNKLWATKLCTHYRYSKLVTRQKSLCNEMRENLNLTTAISLSGKTVSVINEPLRSITLRAPILHSSMPPKIAIQIALEIISQYK